MHKLVRDNIPSLIKEKGDASSITYECLQGNEYYYALMHKLDEEVEELKETSNVDEFIEEAADVCQVLIDWMKFNYPDEKCAKDIIAKIKEKAEARGTFSQGVYIVSVDEKE